MKVVAAVGATLVALVTLAAAANAAGRCGDPATRPWCNTSLSPDARAGLLLRAMTPQERIGLLGGDDRTGVGGGEHNHTGTQDGVPRVGFPTIYYSDGPVGPRQGKVTAMPAPMGDAATWNPRVNYSYGRLVAAEARAKGNDVLYAPNVNLMRTPLNGRTFEAFGEDPFLVSNTAVAWIRGAQSKGVLADVKHFALNNQEGYSSAADQSRPGQPLGPTPDPGKGSRMSVNVHVSDRTMRETELMPFEAAVRRAHAASIMCSYNKLRGTYACQNDPLLQIPRRDWGFKGFVLADYGAAHDAGPSLRSQLDFEPWPGFVYSPLSIRAALVTGQATQADVDRHVRRMLRTFFAYGVLDRAAFKDDTASIPQRAHRRVARHVEEQAITLLKNRRHLLPLRARRLKSIAVIGAGGERFITGGGSGNVTPFRYVSPRAAIAARVRKGTRVLVDDGSDADRAAGVARSAQVAVVLTPDYQTEGTDRRCISLECPPAFGDQDELIRRVAAANKRTVVVLETGGPVLTPWRDRVRALVEAWYPGQEGGTAIARVLFGDVDPGGRLPATFPRSERQLPTAGDPQKYPGTGDEEYYKEGVFLGYKWFDHKRLRPAFPFGFGLSYTRFKLDRLKLRGRRVSARVRNIGRRRGSTVVQLYVGLPSSKAVPQPPRALKGYRKVSLRRHRARTVHFKLTGRDLAYWKAAARGWRIARGRYRVWVGFSSRKMRRVGTFRRARETRAR
jgi:beta-glucosidase